jgi:hypothetical protein
LYTATNIAQQTHPQATPGSDVDALRLKHVGSLAECSTQIQRLSTKQVLDRRVG